MQECLSMDRICSAWNSLGKSIWLHQMLHEHNSAQHLKGYKMYSLYIFLLLLYKTCYFMKLFNFLTFLVDTHNKPCSVPFALHLSPSPEQNNLLCLFPTAGVTLPCNPTTPLHCQLASLLTALRPSSQKGFDMLMKWHEVQVQGTERFCHPLQCICTTFIFLIL